MFIYESALAGDWSEEFVSAAPMELGFEDMTNRELDDFWLSWMAI